MNLDEGLYQPEGSRSSPLHLSCRAGGRRHYKVYGRGGGVGLAVAVGVGVVIVQVSVYCWLSLVGVPGAESPATE